MEADYDVMQSRSLRKSDLDLQEGLIVLEVITITLKFIFFLGLKRNHNEKSQRKVSYGSFKQRHISSA